MVAAAVERDLVLGCDRAGDRGAGRAGPVGGLTSSLSVAPARVSVSVGAKQVRDIHHPILFS